MKRIIVISVLLLCSLVLSVPLLAGSRPPSPPGQPFSGYGSSEEYITSAYHEYSFGSVLNGTKCYYYIPAALKNGSSAPVVVLLHGMILLAPEIYGAHIRHLCRQGYIVVFPQFQQSIVSLMFDMDQNRYLRRAIEAVNGALARIGSRADTSRITLYGHSLGGLLALSWCSEADAPEPRNIVLANPCVDMTAAMPVEIPGMDWLMGLFINQIDYVTRALDVYCPVMILTGNDDTIAPDWTAESLAYDSLVNASSRVVYKFFTDDHGDPELAGDHMASISDDGWMPSWLMTFIGGDGEVDAVDYRYYWAALDAALEGATSLSFFMGSWSDGQGVNTVQRMRP